jgi:acyl-coenzyme A thioesterase PaaI-like protein
MTETIPAGPALRAWMRLQRTGLGRWLFSWIVARRAPYLRTIKPRFLELQPRLCRVWFRKRRAVENHIGTVHALAIGNLCELAAGMCTEVTIPAGMRWIPRSMTIEYLAKAATDVTATARLEKGEWTGAETVGVPVTVTDAAGTEVVRAVINMYVSPRKDGKKDPKAATKSDS